MRLVRYSAQQRVDVPDITAMSALVLGEFRRTIRGLVQGPAGGGLYPVGVVRGFAVVEAGPPDSTVEVIIDPGAGDLGFAIGAEDLGSHADYGQLMGGKGITGAVEGNATLSFDFTGQPVATYRVQARFVYQDGVNDNRAFWDEGADSEFVTATNTRRLPAIELGIAVSPTSLGAEWIPLADVAWGGATVTTADITDVRDFVFEGTVGAFDAATQAGPGGMPDISRSTDRAANGINEILPALRGLARQVQDLKGQDASGNFNWYGRVPRPFDDTNSTLPATQTKSLRTVDTVTYTVGDGVTTWGDFNGATGLEDCLQHLEDLGAQRPNAIEVVLKTNELPFFAWTLTSQHDFRTDDIRLTIRAQGGQQAVIDASGMAANEWVILGSTQSVIILKGLVMGAPFSNNSGIAFVGDGVTPAGGGVIKAYDCSFLGDTSVSANPVLSGDFNQMEIVNCDIQGVVQVTGYNNTQGFVASAGGVIRNCSFQEGGIRGLVSTSGGDSWAVQMLVENCEFEVTETSRLGLNGVLDLGAPVGWTIRDCRINYQGDMDGIHIRYDTASGTKAAQHVKIDNCVITQETTGTHAVDGGTNGTDGTGWGIYLDGASGGGRAGDMAITDCRFVGANIIDAGGLFMNSPLGVSVRGCQWAFSGHDSGAGTRYSAVYITAASGDTEINTYFSDCTIRDWITTTANRVQQTRGFYLNNVADVSFSNCNIDGGSFTTPIARNATYTALYLNGGCEDIKIVACTFENWEGDTGANSRCIVSGTGNIEKVIISASRFRENGGFAVNLNAAATLGQVSIVGNAFLSNLNGIDLRAGVVAQCVCSQNTIFDGAGAGTEGIAWPTGMAAGANSCTGNVSNQNIRGDANIHGHGAGTRDLNSVLGYV